MKRYLIFFSLVAVIGLTGIVANYLLRRDFVHDEMLANDIRVISSSVDSYYLSNKNRLPETLRQADITDANAVSRLSNYSYRVISSTQYQICATFKTKQGTKQTMAIEKGQDYVIPPDPGVHNIGKECFTYTQVPVGEIRASGIQN